MSLSYSHYPVRASALAVLALTLSGCAGKGTGLDSNGRPKSPGGSGGITADFASIQDHVFTPICTVCHAGGGAPQGLRLDSANSYNLLVNVASNEVPSLLRIKPGDPDSSYLVQKIEGHASVGGQMPLGGPPLSAEQIAAIRQWVTDGAQPAAAAAVAPASLKISSTAPATDDLMEAPPPQVMVGFNADLDATRIDAASLRLERIDDSGRVQPVAASLKLTNPRALALTPAAALPPGRYRVWVRTAPGLQLADLNARALVLDGAAGREEVMISSFDVVEQP
jgi:hypothetical protein